MSHCINFVSSCNYYLIFLNKVREEHIQTVKYLLYASRCSVNILLHKTNYFNRVRWQLDVDGEFRVANSIYERRTLNLCPVLHLYLTLFFEKLSLLPVILHSHTRYTTISQVFLYRSFLEYAFKVAGITLSSWFCLQEDVEQNLLAYEQFSQIIASWTSLYREIQVIINRHLLFDIFSFFRSFSFMRVNLMIYSGLWIC